MEANAHKTSAKAVCKAFVSQGNKLVEWGGIAQLVKQLALQVWIIV